MTDLRFDNRVAVITGGGRGLGRAHALLLAARGCKLVINDPGVSMAGDAMAEGPAEALAAEIRAAGGEAVANTDSIATPQGGQAAVEAALDAFGRIDVLIHSAGNVRKALIEDMSFEDFEAVLDVHLRGAFHVVKAAYPRMQAQQYGRMVMTGSINGLYGKANAANYSTAKAGLIGLSHTVAVEGRAHGVQSNVIIPAAVTRMSAGIDVSQFPKMEPEMVAPLACWLAHESCTVSGEMLISAAGRVARAWVAESPGAFLPDASLEDIAAHADAIRDTSAPVIFPPAPDGQLDHLLYSFAMAR